MPRFLENVPNQLTTLRLLLLPVLWALAFARMRFALGLGLLLAGLTDVLDGVIARRTGRTSRFGSQFDSVADMLLAASTLAWVVLLRPDFIRAHAPVLGAWLALGLAALLVGWAKFGRIFDLHLYSAKAAGLAGYGFAVYLFLVDDYSRVVFYAAIAVCFFASAEALVVELARSRVDEHIGSVFRLPGRAPRKGKDEGGG